LAKDEVARTLWPEGTFQDGRKLLRLSVAELSRLSAFTQAIIAESETHLWMTPLTGQLMRADRITHLIDGEAIPDDARSSRFGIERSTPMRPVAVAPNRASSSDRRGNLAITDISMTSAPEVIVTATHSGGDTVPQPKPVVVLIHGIRDVARWIAVLRDVLERAGFEVEPVNYGRFGLDPFLDANPKRRDEAYGEVRKQIIAIQQRHPGQLLNVAAHSFGTYLFAKLLEDRTTTEDANGATIQNPTFKFGRVVFCGSVVGYDFPFQTYHRQFEDQILSEVGTKDIWPAMAKFLSTFYGAGGTFGFNRPYVRDRWHNGANHGFFLTKDFCERFWVPYFRTGEIVEGDVNPDPSPWWLDLTYGTRWPWLLHRLPLIAFLLVIIAVSVAAGIFLQDRAYRDQALAEVSTAQEIRASVEALSPSELDQENSKWVRQDDSPSLEPEASSAFSALRSRAEAAEPMILEDFLSGARQLRERGTFTVCLATGGDISTCSKDFPPDVVTTCETWKSKGKELGGALQHICVDTLSVEMLVSGGGGTPCRPATYSVTCQPKLTR
jgi:hypothetical protein